MKFELNLSIVLVFLVPGIIFSGNILFNFISLEELKDIVEYFSDKKFDFALILISFFFASGAIIDSVKYVVVAPFFEKAAARKIELPKDYLSKIEKENLEIFKVLIERTQVYYRLNTNCLLALVIFDISTLVGLCNNKCIYLFFSLVLTFIFIIASYNSRIAVNYAMNQFCKRK